MINAKEISRMSNEDLVEFFKKFSIIQKERKDGVVYFNINILCPHICIRSIRKYIPEITLIQESKGLVKKTGKVLVIAEPDIDSSSLFPKLIKIIFPEKTIVAEFGDFGRFKELRVDSDKGNYRYFDNSGGH